jgi:hypothetical protein
MVDEVRRYKSQADAAEDKSDKYAVDILRLEGQLEREKAHSRQMELRLKQIRTLVVYYRDHPVIRKQLIEEIDAEADLLRKRKRYKVEQRGASLIITFMVKVEKEQERVPLSPLMDSDFYCADPCE